MNQENQENSDIILNQLNSLYLQPQQVKILDICCGVYDELGIDYDKDGKIYEPIVAQTLAKAGFQVTGLDKRQNRGEKLLFKQIKDIDVLEINWSDQLEIGWDVLIFLRSWDTPEIILHYQKEFGINDINQLSLEIAKIYLPEFNYLLKPGGLLFVTDICNFGLCKNEVEINDYKNQINQLFLCNQFKFIDYKNGLSWYKASENTASIQL